ncbi:uncharacterized protein LOC121378581 isoform X1 [Gigantopelta aegis]|uniref:uncharacterized protein LOC121368236 isoform X1 n=1 Tax=Gigantopelta aegis TaxID=1735272 RepID=UPI001B88D6FB|nr:uncharacterized protein LOC121368236 isoform X1 [Gigantopelta aegis]XP_041349701.1 uncharacterized protein LOC121368984 isoform X1 [Gigantopelta aegis]XP_041362763.1 uncharacterized protein LOC121378581 isoform X1 [Gigantopelta aegis]
MNVRSQNILPYQFEPLVNEERHIFINNSDTEEETDSESEGGDTDGARPIPDGRFGDLGWCDCGNCALMATVEECLCCMEVPAARYKADMADDECVSQHEGFIVNCLNMHVLELAMLDYVRMDGPLDDNDPIHETYRYVAYRRFARWIGQRNRRVLPACVVVKIRDSFPSEIYTGFQYARP